MRGPCALTILAVACMWMTFGFEPHENRITPPARTAATTAADVQLAAVPRPITRVGWAVFTARPCAGTGTVATPAPLGRAGGRPIASGAARHSQAIETTATATFQRHVTAMILGTYRTRQN
jgi:hypothetical protein